MFIKATTVVVAAADKEGVAFFSFTVSCSAIKFIGQGPKWYKNRWLIFGISDPEKS